MLWPEDLRAFLGHRTSSTSPIRELVPPVSSFVISLIEELLDIFFSSRASVSTCTKPFIGDYTFLASVKKRLLATVCCYMV